MSQQREIAEQMFFVEDDGTLVCFGETRLSAEEFNVLVEWYRSLRRKCA